MNVGTDTRAKVRAGLAAGLSAKEIARLVGRADGTVRVHTAAIYRELGVHNRAQAALKLAGNGADRYARPGPDQIDAALREIRATLKACDEGDMPIAAALNTIHGLSDIGHPDTLMAALEECAA